MKFTTTLDMTAPTSPRPPQLPLTFEIAGSSHGTYYRVTKMTDGTWACERADIQGPCPDFFYRKHQCKHIQKARIQCGEVTDIDPGDLL